MRHNTMQTLEDGFTVENVWLYELFKTFLCIQLHNFTFPLSSGSLKRL